MFPFTESAQRTLRKRRRAAKSCQECRRCKTRCDRNEPCSHCILSKTPCIYSGHPAKGIATPGVTTPFQWSEIRLRPHSETATLPRSGSGFAAIPGNRNQTVRNQGRSSSLVSTAPVFNKEQELSKLRRRVQILEELLSKSTPVASIGVTPPSTVSELENAPLVPQAGLLTLNKSRLFGESHWSNTAALEFRRIAAVLEDKTADSTDSRDLRNLIHGIRSLLQRCKVLAKSRKVLEHTRPSTWIGPDFSMLKLFADDMAHNYTSHFESAFRILHIPSFWAEYEEYWRSPSEPVGVLQLKIQLIVAIGSSLHQHSSEGHDEASSFRSTACQWVQDTQQWLSAPAEKERLSIDALQVHCLLILARQVLNFGGDLVYIAMGNVVRTALQMGLHRDPRQFKKMTPFQGEIRRRLWATLLELNLQASLDAGVLPTLLLDVYDTDGPSNVNDADMNDAVHFLPRYSKDAITDTSLQRNLFDTVRRRYEIFGRMNGTRSSMSYSDIRVMTTELTNACRDYKVFVKGDGSGAAFRTNMADLPLRRLLLCLHRPLASRARTDPAFYFSRKISLDAAMILLSPVPDDAFSHLTVVSGGMFKNRMIHVSTALAAELLREVEENGPTTSPTGYRKMVVIAVKEALRQTEERIRLGDTNADVKMHMKLSMTLCQAEGRSGGVSSLHNLARAALGSLEASCSTLQARARSQTEDDIKMVFQEDHTHESHFLDSGFELDDIFGTFEFDMDEVMASETALV